MATALEKLGLTPTDLQTVGQPQAGPALGKLGLGPNDLATLGRGAAPAVAAAPAMGAGAGPTAATAGGAPEDQLGKLASGGLGALQGATFGFSDELAGILRGAMGALPGGEGFQTGFQQGTETVRGLHERAQPGAFLAGDIAGSLVLPGGAVRAGGTLAAKAGRAALSGAVQGGIGGAGRAEGTTERIPEAVAGAGFGGAVGGALGSVLPGATTAIKRLVGEGVETVDEAGGKAIGAIQDAARGKRAGVKEAYNRVARLDGRIEGQAAYDLLGRQIDRTLDEGGFLYTPGVGDEIKKVTTKLLDDLGPSANVQQIEGARKGLNRAIGNLRADPARQAAMVAVKDTFDDWMTATINAGFYRGDPAITETLKKARGLNTEYQRLFGVGGKTPQDRAAGRIIDTLIKDDVGAGEAVNMLFGMAGTGVNASRKAMARVRDASPEALDQMKIAHFNKILSPNGGPFDSAQAIANRVQKLNANQGQMMKILYGDDLPALNRFAADLSDKGSIAHKVGHFITSKPRWVRAGMTGLGAGTAYASGENPFIGAIVGALLGGGATRGAKAGQLAGAARRADRPYSSTISGRAARVGGIGPSLSEG